MNCSLRYIVLLVGILGVYQDATAQNMSLLRRPKNGAISAPMGQGLDLVHSAEPLGAGRFRLRIMNRSSPIVVPQLGEGSIYTGGYGIGYGLSDRLDLSFTVPFLLDSVNGLNKYGTSDPVLGIKLSRPGKLPSDFYTGYQLLIGLPLGYKGEHALDAIGGIRTFSSESLDIGLQGLMDFHFKHVSLLLNGGLYRSGNPEVMSQLIWGGGLEFGRRSRWASFNIEYQSQVAFSQQATAVSIIKMGTRFNIMRGMDLELNREFGLLDHPTGSSFTFGVRLHGFMTGERRLAWRHIIYKPVPPPKRLYRPSQVLRLAIVDFEGFEEFGAGQRIVEKIKHRLEPHDSLEVVDLARYANVPNEGFLKPRQALELAKKLGIDIVVTGAVSQFGVDRFAGLNVPYMVKLPQAQAEVGLRYRVLEFDHDKSQMKARNQKVQPVGNLILDNSDGIAPQEEFDTTKNQIQAKLVLKNEYSQEVKGVGKMRRGMRLFSGDQRDITSSASAVELQSIQEAALDDLVGNMLAAMAEQFSWVPPEFIP